mmetsp:Transcript_34454/g.31147  ORF Transcript_34454/g.31147 Transcript_34454/m.31147 type:complete len:84 (+) Transcript_34454:868-1119(+)
MSSHHLSGAHSNQGSHANGISLQQYEDVSPHKSAKQGVSRDIESAKKHRRNYSMGQTPSSMKDKVEADRQRHEFEKQIQQQKQ